MTENDKNDVPLGISVIPDKVPKKFGKRGVDWFSLKTEYLSNRDVNIKDLAKKYDVSDEMIRRKARRELWVKDKQILYAKVANRTQDILVEKQAQIAARHALLAKLLQKEGVEVIKKRKVPIKSAKVALEYIVEGVRIEREAEGLAQRAPQVVNIISQQQGIIDKYANNKERESSGN